LNFRKGQFVILLVPAFVGWALVGLLTRLGASLTSVSYAPITHALVAPAVFSFLTIVYYKKFKTTLSPLRAAIVSTCFVIGLDLFLVTLMSRDSIVAIFENAVGMWLPFYLIFFSTYLVGMYIKGGRTKVPVPMKVAAASEQ